ncbi:MAG: aminoglycoside phosphotransferase family protein [Gammaproteobacteria bacterium]
MEVEHGQRQAAIEWAKHALARSRPGCELSSWRHQPLAGDASSRSYERMSYCCETIETSRILMISPPASGEKNAEFVAMQGILQEIGIRVPHIYDREPVEGWMLLTDFGDRRYLDQIHAAQSEQDLENLYHPALQVMAVVQACPLSKLAALSVMNRERALSEMQLFPQWYLQGLLQIDIDPEAQAALTESLIWLADQFVQQPMCLTHFDFHSCNLLYQDDGVPALLDFQDALIAPWLLDPVSLLRDCYFELKPHMQSRLLSFYVDRMQQLQWQVHFEGRVQNMPWSRIDRDQVRFWFEICSLQRHLRVLGTFGRLHLRDGRSAHLADLPATLCYCLRAASELPQLVPLLNVLKHSEPLLARFLKDRDAF